MQFSFHTLRQAKFAQDQSNLPYPFYCLKDNSNAYFSHLRIIMYEGVCDSDAMRLVRPSKIMKGRRRCEQPLPQVVGEANL